MRNRIGVVVAAAFSLALAACSAGGSTSGPVIQGATALPDGIVGTSYSTALTATAEGPVAWTMAAGDLPLGLTLAQDGTIAGTPSMAGESTFWVTATDGVGSTTGEYSIEVFAPPSITAPSLPLANATLSEVYSVQFAATGDAPITWSITAGALPTGLAFAPSGTISGTPVAISTANFTVAATNAVGSDTLACQIVVLPIPSAPSITGPPALPDAAVGIAYSQAILAAGTAPITWSVSAGSLPTGLSLAPGSGVIAGTSVAVESTSFTVTATNAQGSDSRAFTLDSGYSPVLNSLSPASGVAGGTIKLQGSGFSGLSFVNSVKFGTTAALVLAATTTELSVQVPAGIGATENVTVTIGSEVTAAQTFTLDTTSVVFVDDSATGLDDGTSWISAYPSLATALAAAGPSDEIWVAAGSYSPGTNPADFFAWNGDRVYGGFAANEALRSQRDTIVNDTILTGDVNGDSVGFTNLGDNNTLVVKVSGSGNVLDGLHITQGISTTFGAGVMFDDGAVGNLQECEVYLNRANEGAGVLLLGAAAGIDRCVIRDNIATSGFGGGCAVAMSSGPGIATVSDSVFVGNQGVNGGGFANLSISASSFENVVFAGNSASGNGGAVYVQQGGATLVSSTFTANAANIGGACYHLPGNAMTIANTIFWANIGSVSQPDVYSNGTVIHSYCVVATSDVGGGASNYQNCQTGDPLFVDVALPQGADGMFFTSDDGLLIGSGGSAHDNGNTAGPTADIRGVARPQGAAYDIGAYERQ